MSFGNNDIASTIDRMINVTTNNNLNNLATTASSSSASASLFHHHHHHQAPFLPSKSFQGPIGGYYFGTSDQGTGYYIDNQQSKGLKRVRNEEESTINGSAHQRRKVRFGQDEIQTFDYEGHNNDNDNQKTTISNKLTPQQFLLEQAEQTQKSKSTKTLDLSRTKSTSTSIIKSSILNLEKAISKNQLLRVKYATDPTKFMNSELNLYEEIELWNDLATSIEYYSFFVSMGGVDCLKSLLIHDNVDIVLCIVKLFNELLDPDLLVSGDVGGVEGGGGGEDLNVIGEQLCTLLVAFLGWGDSKDDDDDDRQKGTQKKNENNGLDMVIANLARLSDSEEEELKGIDDIITLVENILDLDQYGVLKLAPPEAIMYTTSSSSSSSSSSSTGDNDDSKRKTIVAHLTRNTTFTSYLLMKLSDKKLQGWTTTMKLHASEVLASIIQHEDSRITLSNISNMTPYQSMFDEEDKETKPNNQNKKQVRSFDGMECLLQAMAVYRKKDPTNDEECEYLENICNAIAASLLNEENVNVFLETEGVELMLRCINERVHTGFCAMKILFFCVSGSSEPYKRAAETFVDAGGLKSLFPIFMNKKSSMPKPARCSDAGNLNLIRKYSQLQKENRRKGGDEQHKKPTKRMKQVLAANREWYQTLESHSIQILYGLTRHLDENSPHDAKSRLASKFVENDCEKCDRLVELALKYDIKMRQAEYEYFKSDEAEEAEESGIDIDFLAMNAKLKGGGDLFHRLAALIGFAATESKRSHKHILEQLRIQNSGIATIKSGMNDFASIITDEGSQKNQLLRYLSAI